MTLKRVIEGETCVLVSNQFVRVSGKVFGQGQEEAESWVQMESSAWSDWLKRPVL